MILMGIGGAPKNLCLSDLARYAEILRSPGTLSAIERREFPLSPGP
jgi:hypothetical protein